MPDPKPSSPRRQNTTRRVAFLILVACGVVWCVLWDVHQVDDFVEHKFVHRESAPPARAAARPRPVNKQAALPLPPPGDNQGLGIVVKPWILVPRRFLYHFTTPRPSPCHHAACHGSAHCGGAAPTHNDMPAYPYIQCHDVASTNATSASALDDVERMEAETVACDWNAPPVHTNRNGTLRGEKRRITGTTAHSLSLRRDNRLWGVQSVNEGILLKPTMMHKHVAVFVSPVLRRSARSAIGASAISSAFHASLDRLRSVAGTYAMGGDIVNPRACLTQLLQNTARPPGAPPTVVFVGHSHQRLMAAMLCMMWNATNCTGFTKHLSTSRANQSVSLSSFEVRRAEDHITARFDELSRPALVLGFVRATADLRLRIGGLGDDHPAWSNAVGYDSDASAPDVVIYGRGPWDLVYWGATPSEFVSEMTGGLIALHRALPPHTKVVLYLQHYTQPLPVLQRRAADRWQHTLRHTCLSEQRTQAARMATLCAVKAAIARLDSNSTSATHGEGVLTLRQRLRLFDVFHETEALPRESVWATRFTDYGGHHYLDVVLEALVRKFLGAHVCPRADVEGRCADVVDAYLDTVGATDVCASMANCTDGTSPCALALGWGNTFHQLHCSCGHRHRRVHHVCTEYEAPKDDAARTGKETQQRLGAAGKVHRYRLPTNVAVV